MKRIFIIFAIIVDINANAQVCFTDTNYYSGQESTTIYCTDFNNDGKPDLVIAYNAKNIRLLPGDGLGGFGAAIPVLTDSATMTYRKFYCKDFNNDGNADLALTKWSNPSIGYIDIFWGNGTGNFPASDTYAVAPYPDIIYSDDFNGDGNPDIVLAHNDACDSILVLLGDGMGYFSTHIDIDYSVGLNISAITSGDFNGDNKTDLAVTRSISGNADSLWVFLGDGTGNFGTASKYLAGAGPVSVCSKDFNGDGFDDIAVANSNSDNVSVFISNGTSGTFFSAVNYNATPGPSMYPFSVVSEDFNMDGKLDLAVADYYNIIYILLGEGNGTFGATTYYPANYGPWTIISADFNSDGKPDLATANKSSDDITVLLNCTTQGIDEIHNKLDVLIYPNPTTGIFSVETNPAGKLSVQIFDLAGKMVLSHEINDKTDINASCLSAGIYNLTIKNNAGIINEKLVIVR